MPAAANTSYKSCLSSHLTKSSNKLIHPTSSGFSACNCQVNFYFNLQSRARSKYSRHHRLWSNMDSNIDEKLHKIKAMSSDQFIDDIIDTAGDVLAESAQYELLLYRYKVIIQGFGDKINDIPVDTRGDDQQSKLRRKAVARIRRSLTTIADARTVEQGVDDLTVAVQAFADTVPRQDRQGQTSQPRETVFSRNYHSQSRQASSGALSASNGRLAHHAQSSEVSSHEHGDTSLAQQGNHGMPAQNVQLRPAAQPFQPVPAPMRVFSDPEAQTLSNPQQTLAEQQTILTGTEFEDARYFQEPSQLSRQNTMQSPRSGIGQLARTDTLQSIPEGHPPPSSHKYGNAQVTQRAQIVEGDFVSNKWQGGNIPSGSNHQYGFTKASGDAKVLRGNSYGDSPFSTSTPRSASTPASYAPPGNDQGLQNRSRRHSGRQPSQQAY